MKKLVCFVLGIVLMLSLAACGTDTASRTVFLLTEETLRNSDGSVQSQYSYEYDDRGNLLKATFPSASYDRVFQHTYDDYGYLTQTTQTDILPTAEVTSVYQYRYTLKKGLPETCQVLFNDQLQYSCTFQTNRKGLITRVDYDYPEDVSQQKVDRWQTYEYDKSGNLTRESFCASVPYFPELRYSVYQYRYEYDKQGNLQTLIYEFGSMDEEIHNADKITFEQQHIWTFLRGDRGELTQVKIDGEPYDFTVTAAGNSIPEIYSDWEHDQAGNVISTGNRTYTYESAELSGPDADRFDRWNVLLRNNGSMPVGVSMLRMTCLPTYTAFHENLFYYYLIPNPLA